MNSITVTATVRTNQPITQAAIVEIVQGIRQGLQQTVTIKNNGTEETTEQTNHEKKKLTVALEC